MKGEILTLETAQNLANRERALKYIDKQLKGAYTTYNLKWDTVIELQTIENILKGKEPIQEKKCFG